VYWRRELDRVALDCAALLGVKRRARPGLNREGRGVGRKKRKRVGAHCAGNRPRPATTRSPFRMNNTSSALPAGLVARKASKFCGGRRCGEGSVGEQVTQRRSADPAIRLC
jgi:hypothetical protein